MASIHAVENEKQLELKAWDDALEADVSTYPKSDSQLRQRLFEGNRRKAELYSDLHRLDEARNHYDIALSYAQGDKQKESTISACLYKLPKQKNRSLAGG